MANKISCNPAVGGAVLIEVEGVELTYANGDDFFIVNDEDLRSDYLAVTNHPDVTPGLYKLTAVPTIIGTTTEIFEEDSDLDDVEDLDDEESDEEGAED